MTDQTNKDLPTTKALRDAIGIVDSKYFGDSALDPKEHDAVDTLMKFAQASLSASAPADILRMRQQLEQEWCELQKLKASYASAPAALSTGDLRDRLVAVSSAIADQDDREAQAILREAMRLLDSAPAAGSVPSDAEIDELLPLGMAPYTTLCGPREIRKFARTLLAQYGSPAIPDVLFDGHTVFQALYEKAKGRTSAENVSDVLDAAVRVLRARANAPQEGK